MTSDDASSTLSILMARADEMRAELLVRMPHAAAGRDGERPRLSGRLTGPRRGRDMTLPTSVPLVACYGEIVGARATFTEPAFWTPEMPNLYRLEARLVHDGQTLAEVDRMVGLRRLGVRGRSLWLDGRRWVPRGVSIAAGEWEPEALRGLHAAAEIRDPDASLLAIADQKGVAIVARLEDAAGGPLGLADACGRLASWGLHPSVAITVVPRAARAEVAASVAAIAGAARGTILVGLEVDGTRSPSSVDAGLVDAVDCLVVDLPDGSVPHDDWRMRVVDVPLVARRRMTVAAASPPVGVERLACQRHECDRLQACLAAWGLAGRTGGQPSDWAGYLSTAW